MCVCVCVWGRVCVCVCVCVCVIDNQLGTEPVPPSMYAFVVK